MIKLVNRAVVLLVMCAITSLPALAGTVTRKVTFKQDVKVNGTVVKAGTYKVVFDDETGELSIIKGDKTVAKAPARLEGKSSGEYSSFQDEKDHAVLVSVTLKGGDRAVIGGSSDSAAREQ